MEITPLVARNFVILISDCHFHGSTSSLSTSDPKHVRHGGYGRTRSSDLLDRHIYAIIEPVSQVRVHRHGDESKLTVS